MEMGNKHATLHLEEDGSPDGRLGAAAAEHDEYFQEICSTGANLFSSSTVSCEKRRISGTETLHMEAED